LPDRAESKRARFLGQNPRCGNHPTKTHGWYRPVCNVRPGVRPELRFLPAAALRDRCYRDELFPDGTVRAFKWAGASDLP